VPANVIRAARKNLLELERSSGNASPQGDLFTAPLDAAAPVNHAEHPALQLLRDTEPDVLTPKQALELLYRLKQLDS
jgi:DNA mismatch repair protein MutS